MLRPFLREQYDLNLKFPIFCNLHIVEQAFLELDNEKGKKQPHLH